jgi:Skp family chaperone for outer membrane proteins
LELKLFEDRLSKFLTQESQKENSAVITRESQLMDKINQTEEKLNSEVTKYSEEVRKWNEAMQNEIVGLVKEGRTGKAGSGPAYREAERNLAENKKLLADAQKKLDDFNIQKTDEIKRIQDDSLKKTIKQTYGFLSKFEALEDLKSQSLPAWSLAWLIRMLFVLVELFPAFIKLFLPYSIYDALLEAKRRDTIQVIHRNTNDRMEDVTLTPPKYPKQLLLEKLEANFSSQSNSPNP